MTPFQITILGSFTCLGVYLFATAPEPIPEKSSLFQKERTVDVEKMFNAVNAVNHVAREIYTKRIVGAGVKKGLKFGEDWSEPGVEKGPLPALFLRLAARRMETKPEPLGLYLGSDAPINKSNLFDDTQASAFEMLRTSKEAVFLESDLSGFVGMYPDIASAGPCVTCHNDHPDSPKTDWKLNDVMGATTWTYPSGEIGASDYLSVTEAFYLSVREAYELYLNKTRSFSNPIPIGNGWPDGDVLILPDQDTFMTAVRMRASEVIVSELVLITPHVPQEKIAEVVQ